MSTVTPNLGMTEPAAHDQNWGVPTLNENFTIIDDFAATVVLYAPTLSQTVTQPSSTYFNFNYPIVFLAVNPALRFGTAANIWDSALTRTGPGVFTLDSNVPANAAATLTLAAANAGFFNATSGFQLNGTAPNNHILVGNGTEYVDSATVPSSALPNFYYQTVQAAGSSQPQEAKLNFLAPMTAVDNPGNGSTDVSVPTAITGTAIMPNTPVGGNTCNAYGISWPSGPPPANSVIVATPETDIGGGGLGGSWSVSVLYSSSFGGYVVTVCNITDTTQNPNGCTFRVKVIP